MKAINWFFVVYFALAFFLIFVPHDADDDTKWGHLAPMSISGVIVWITIAVLELPSPNRRKEP